MERKQIDKLQFARVAIGKKSSIYVCLSAFGRWIYLYYYIIPYFLQKSKGFRAVCGHFTGKFIKMLWLY